MNKIAKSLLYLLFILAYSVFLSIGMECFLCVLFLYMSLPFESPSGPELFPRLFTFSVITGALMLVALVAVAILNYKYSDNLGCTKKRFLLVAAISFFTAISMIPIWEKALEFLQAAF